MGEGLAEVGKERKRGTESKKQRGVKKEVRRRESGVDS